ncbi:MAG: hypothetical protein JXR94_04570 [Candidatus Hydrogenedentes bacterium]|nr:hypothetical protein [Candidatus Hydrogenedentota bacterium]
MKHIAPITKKAPRPAAAWQDMLCYIVEIIYDLVGAIGGEIPFLTYLADKCP